MIENDFQQVKSMLAFLKGVGIMDNREVKKIMGRATVRREVTKRRELTEGAFE